MQDTSYYFPLDTMQEILYQSDIHSFVGLCNTSKIIQGLCNNDMWKYKFNQYHIKIVDNPTTYHEWMQLYNDHYNHLKAKVYIEAYPKNDTNASIYLDRPLSNKKLRIILNRSGAKWNKINCSHAKYDDRSKIYQTRTQQHQYNADFEELINSFYIDRTSEYIIPLRIRETDNYIYGVTINNLYTLTSSVLKEFIYQLFKHGYLI